MLLQSQPPVDKAGVALGAEQRDKVCRAGTIENKLCGVLLRRVTIDVYERRIVSSFGTCQAEDIF